MADDLAVLGFSIETGPIDKAKKSLADLAAMGSKVETSAKGIEGSSASAGRAIGGLGTEAKKAGTEIKRASDEVDGMSTKMGQLSGLADLAKTAFAAISVAALAREFVQIADSANMMAARLRLATTSVAEFAEAQRSIYSIAQTNNVGLKETTDLYTKLADPIRKLGGTASDTSKIVQALGASLLISGASSQESSAAILQFAQAMASGRLQGDELRSLSEAAPRFMKALADGIGVGTGALKEMGSEGQLTADVVGNALIKSLADLKKEAAGIGDSVSGSFQRFTNDLQQTIEALDKTFGVTREVATGLSVLAALTKNVGDVFRDDATAGANSATGAFDSFGVRAQVLGTVLETVLVVAANVGHVLKTVGFEIGAAAAGIGVWADSTGRQLEAFKSGNFAEMPKIAKAALTALGAIRDASAEDIANSAKSLDAFQERVLSITKKAQQAHDALKMAGTVDVSGSDRKFEGGSATLKAAADDKELLEIRLKLAGINKDYLESLTKLQKAYDGGRLPLEEYKRLVTELAVATYKSSAAGKEAAKAMQSGSKDAAKSAADDLAAQVEALRRSVALRAQITQGYVKHQTALFRAGSISEIELIERVADEEAKSFVDRKAALENEAKLMDRKKDSRKAIAAINAQLASLDQAASDAEVENADKVLAAMQRIQIAVADRFDAELKGANTLEDQVRLARREGEEINKTAAELAKLTLARTEAAAVQLEIQAAMKDDIELSDHAGDALRRQAAAIRELGKQSINNDALKSLDKYLDPRKAEQFGDTLASAFGKAGNAVSALAKVFGDYSKKQLAFDDERAKARGISDPVKQAKVLADIEESSAKAQLQNYANLAGAAKGFFDEGSKGYKTLQAAEQAFTLISVAQGAIRAAQSAVEAVLNQAKGDPYTAWARMAAMAAVVATLGYAVAGGFNSGSSGPSAADRQAAQGTGTVLGDATAKSDSIANSLANLKDSAKIELQYQSEMVASLRSIDNAMSGLASLVVRTTGLTSGNNFGVATGTLSKNKGDPILGMLGFNDSFATKNLGPISSLIGGLQGLFGKVSQAITDTGLIVQGAVSELAAGRGVSQFEDFQTTSSSLFGLIKKTTPGSISGPVSDEFAKQFGLIFTSLGDTLKSAAGALGRDGDAFKAAIDNYVVDLGKISLRGLSGADLQEALNNIISSAADKITGEVLPGFDQFQKIGEGLFQTVVRVATGVEDASYALEKFGISAVNLSQVINKQGDIGAEIVRQSILNYETKSFDAKTGQEGRMNISGDADRSGVTSVVTGVGKIIESLSGSADDIAQVYQALLDVRGVMRSVGETGLDLSQSMLRGAGGLEALKSGLDSYFDGFFSTSEQTAAKTARLAEKFQGIGVALPDSNAGFRQLVEGIDTSTDAGQLLYGQVINLAGSFADLYPMVASTASAIDLTNAKRAQDIRVMELQGNAAGALAARREDELAGLDESLRARQQYIYSLEDEATAQQAAAQAASEAAAKSLAIANERAGLERQILELQGDTAGLRALDIAALDQSNRSLLERIHAMTDEKAAADAAAQAAQAMADAARQAAEALASQAKALMDQIFSLENAGNTSALRGKELSEMDASLRPLQERIYALQDEAAAQAAARQAQDEAARAAQALADAAKQAADALASQARNLLDQIFALENVGNTGAIRQKELSQLDASLRPLQERIYALQDEAAAQDLARQAQEEAARAAQALADAAKQAAEALAQQAQGLLDQIFALENAGDTSALRGRELSTMDASLRPLQERIYALQDEAAAMEAAATAAQALAAQAQSLQEQIFQLQNAGNTTALREHELSALDASLRPLQERIFALQDEKQAQEDAARAAQALADAARQAAEALAAQAKSLLDEIFQLENAGNTGALRERELSAMDASLRPLKERIFALQDLAAAESAAAAKVKAAADERYGIQGELLNLLGDTAAIRARELAQLDPTNRALKEQVFALQDQQAAAAAAQQAADQAAAAAKQLGEAWANLADGILAEVNRIRGAIAGESSQALSGLQADFAINTAQARAGDQAAAAALPGISQALQAMSQSTASSAAEFKFAQAQTAASLEVTADIARRLGPGAESAYLAGTPSMPSYTIQQPQTVFITSDPGAQERIASLEAKIAEQDERLETMAAALVQIAVNTGKTARTLDNASNGDSLAVSTRTDDVLTVTP